ncbi:unnamed protein product, partial [Ixodes pacificus]
FAQDGHVTVEEFKQAVQNLCVGKTFEQFPQPLKHAINCKYATADANGTAVTVATVDDESERQRRLLWLHARRCDVARVLLTRDGLLSLDEFRLECISRQAIRDLDEIDDCYQRLLT